MTASPRDALSLNARFSQTLYHLTLLNPGRSITFLWRVIERFRFSRIK